MTEGDRHDFFRLSIATIGNQMISKPFTVHRSPPIHGGIAQVPPLLSRRPHFSTPGSCKFPVGYSDWTTLSSHAHGHSLASTSPSSSIFYSVPHQRDSLLPPPSFVTLSASDCIVLLPPQRSMRWVSRGERRVRINPMTTTSNGIIIRPGLLAIQRRRLRL